MGSLLAVYHDRHEAEAAAQDLMGHVSVPGNSLHVGERVDLELSLRAEMDAETSEVIGSPGLGSVMTKEMFRGAALLGLGLGGLGLIVGAVLGLVLAGASGWSTGERVLLGVVIGALFFGTVGTLLGGGLAMKSPEDQLAAERGVTLRVDSVSAEAKQVLAEHHPIRLDVLSGTRRLATPVTEEPSGLAEAVGEFVANSEDALSAGLTASIVVVSSATDGLIERRGRTGHHVHRPAVCIPGRPGCRRPDRRLRGVDGAATPTGDDCACSWLDAQLADAG